MGLIGAAAADEYCIFALQNPGDNRGERQEDSLHLCFAVSPELIDHFRNPRNVGELAAPAITAEASNPVCGDIMRLSVRMEHGRVAEAGYKVRGCAASIAAGSALTVLLHGRNRAELSLVNREMVESSVGGLSNESKHAAVLCVDAVRAILKLC
jgi:nitrogen fixation NifU-like protein